MSSSDYTALRKLKQIQGACKVDELGNPVSTSWYDIPMGERQNCELVLGTGPTGPRGQIGYTGPAGFMGYTGPAGPTNGGVFALYAESYGLDNSNNSGF
jgi:hypothetical protein